MLWQSTWVVTGFPDAIPSPMAPGGWPVPCGRDAPSSSGSAGDPSFPAHAKVVVACEIAALACMAPADISCHPHASRSKWSEKMTDPYNIFETMQSRTSPL